VEVAMSNAVSAPTTRGVVFVHACPPALAAHVEWAIAEVLKRSVTLSWTPQPASPGQLRSEATWYGPVGTAARLAAGLRAWPMLRFELTEEASAKGDGERLAFVPGRGFHRSLMSSNGDLVVGEERVRGLLARARTADDFRHGLEELLGSEWDAELEPYREGGDGSPVTLLHHVV
jgi:hypothetical protein